jgi:RNA polymerase sigma-70 factor (sigma-E family)
MTAERDTEFADYVGARLPALRRLAMLLCQDWHRADDLVQAAITKLYVHWPRAKGADSIDAYVRAIVVREFLRERRSSWARRVTVSDQVPDRPSASHDTEASLDLQAAIAALPARQRATLVLRFYCDLNVDQSARVLGCTPGTVKSQTAKALATLRRALGPEDGPDAASAPFAIHADSPLGEAQ